MPLWISHWWAQAILICGGLTTAVFSTLVSRIRCDRKGSVSYSTSATLGLVYVILAFGHADLALIICFGHAAIRMTQIMRSPNNILDLQNLRASLRRVPWPKPVPRWLFRLAWFCRRIDTDFHLLNVLMLLSPGDSVAAPMPWWQQWLATLVVVFIAGAPFTPLSHWLEHKLMHYAEEDIVMFCALAFGHFVISVLLVRYLFVRVLSAHRFHRM
jgi:hypothetical protein